MISVIIPTVAGREEHLIRCIDAYNATLAEYDYELIVIKDQDTCGLAWNMGAEKASGDYLHMTADDLEPKPGWPFRALEVVDGGALPAPRILGADGKLESCGDGQENPEGSLTDFTRIPLMSRAQWELIGPSLDCHYYTDNWISWMGRVHGIPTVVVRSYLFQHHWATVRRGAGTTESIRMNLDRDLFLFQRGRVLAKMGIHE